MSRSMRLVLGLVGLILIVVHGAGRAEAMGMEEFGPAGEHIGRSPDWPKGIEDVLRHPARVYWRDVNGSQNAYYDGDIDQVNELLELYSHVKLAQHPVVILPGKPSAMSFDRKFTPYVVKFVVPGTLETHFRQRHGGVARFSLMPRMIVHLDATLAAHLDKLTLPKNVTLHSSEQGESKLAEGETAAKQWAAKSSADQPLRQRLAEFVDGHPQRARVPSPQELLSTLQKVDADYDKGFTARGTRVEPAISGPGKLVGWTVTMDRDRLVIEQLDVEDADHPRKQGRFEYTNYAGPGRMGSIHHSRHWVDGNLIEANPQATLEPVGSTYDLLIARFMWPLGRGFTSRIDHINSVSQDGDGLLKVAAECYNGNFIRRWELVIDPQADYLVRAAKAYRADESEPSYVVETAGVLAGGGRYVAHTARWIEGAGAEPASIAVTNVSSAIDEPLIQRTEQRLGKPSLQKK
jgi:hypothetical protein